MTNREDVLSPHHPKQLERKHYAKIPALDPRDGETWDLLLPPSLLEETQKRGIGRTKELAFTVREHVLKIRHVFRGIRDTDDQHGCDEWLCYVSTPSHAYDYKTGNRVHAWPDEEFCVFVTDERYVYNFYWCECDPDDCTLPKEWKTRFIEKVL